MKLTRATLKITPLVAWLASALVAIGVVAVLEYRAGLAELSEWARQTDTQLAEKLAQHDAHMTALAAVIHMDTDEPSASVQGLAGAVIAFYPRITDIATIRVAGAKARVIHYGRSAGPSVDTEQTIDGFPQLQKPGETAVRTSPGSRSYDIYKLVDTDRLLRLRIDAGGLLASQLLPAEYSFSLLLGDYVLSARPAKGAKLLVAERSLSSNNPTQPLRLDLGRAFGPGELFPAGLILPLLLMLAIIVWLAVQYRNARSERQRQELRATLLEQEARLAHAGRVNALGEMASGIAHELAQPITAMLAQSQAARRALTLDRSDILEQALDANIREAKRAGDILGRMRAYISGAASQMEKVELDEALNGALRLIATDLTQRGIALDVSISEQSCTVMIDVISFQQVIHNLIRNAAEAMTGRPGPCITLQAGPDGSHAFIVITDNGPGIEAASLDRIFEPFFTTKPDGMGLGLPLCARLIEKMDGTIEARNEGGACFTIRLPCEEAR